MISGILSTALKDNSSFKFATISQGVEKPENFWEHTSDNAVIETFLDKTEFDVTEKFEVLLTGSYIKETKKISDLLLKSASYRVIMTDK